MQVMAGHEDLKTTMKYIHLVGGSVEEFANNYKIFSPKPKLVSVDCG